MTNPWTGCNRVELQHLLGSLQVFRRVCAPSDVSCLQNFQLVYDIYVWMFKAVYALSVSTC